MKKQIIALSLLLTVLLLAGCFQQIQTATEVVKSEVLTELDSYVEILQMSIGEDLNEVNESNVATTALDPSYARKVKFTRGLATREILSENDVIVNEELGTATVKVFLTIPGEAELYDANGELLGVKDATLAGNCTYELIQVNNRWKVSQRQIELTTAESAISIEEPIVNPQPVQVGSSFTVQTNITGDTNIRAIVRNRHSRSPLLYFSEDEFFKTLPIQVDDQVDPGLHIAMIKAVAWESARDLTKDPETEEFTVPVQMTLKSFFIEVE